ncbi:unnamed protein product [Arctogadus glacialis]
MLGSKGLEGPARPGPPGPLTALLRSTGGMTEHVDRPLSHMSSSTSSSSSSSSAAVSTNPCHDTRGLPGAPAGATEGTDHSAVGSSLFFDDMSQVLDLPSAPQGPSAPDIRGSCGPSQPKRLSSRNRRNHQCPGYQWARRLIAGRELTRPLPAEVYSCDSQIKSSITICHLMQRNAEQHPAFSMSTRPRLEGAGGTNQEFMEDADGKCIASNERGDTSYSASIVVTE